VLGALAAIAGALLLTSAGRVVAVILEVLLVSAGHTFAPLDERIISSATEQPLGSMVGAVAVC
jgi:hypothetical protein